MGLLDGVDGDGMSVFRRFAILADGLTRINVSGVINNVDLGML